MPRVELSSAHMVEGKHDSRRGEAAIGRIPVTSQDSTPLMPCTPTKARKRLETGKARKQWSKLGIFHIQLLGLCYVGGNLANRFSLHSPGTGKRLTQNAKREDFKIITRIAFRTQFPPQSDSGGFLNDAL